VGSSLSLSLHTLEYLCVSTLCTGGYVERLNRSKFDLFPDIVMSYLYMFDSLLGNRFLCIEYSAATISEEWNKINWFAEFCE